MKKLPLGVIGELRARARGMLEIWWIEKLPGDKIPQRQL
jgi:hypothetical protein